MAMNFFEHQDRARRRTGRLVLFFGMAVVCIIAVLYVAGMVAFNWAEQSSSGQHGQPSPPVQLVFWNWEVLLAVVGLGILIIGGGSFYRISQLSSGGSVVAESLGGTVLDPGSRKPDERKLLNVVEEMAIASGVPVPPVYIIEDDTINAFAAGFKPNDAVIGVTRGCIANLDRDQLQGVIAHEFSHIFNGDMRLNIRLIGVIYGLIVLGTIGYFLLRIMVYSGGGRRSSNNKGGGILVAIMLFGLVMMVLGFVGTFFGRLIQAAVSRQREFLADASAVQYTRNPGGIAGALRAIADLPAETSMSSTASEYNHMFFSQAINSIFASHPPIRERIASIEQVPVESIGEAQGTPSSGAGSAGVSGFADNVPTSSLHKAVATIGSVDAHAVAAAGHVIQSIPAELVDAARTTWSARLLVLSLLVASTGDVREQQLAHIQSQLDDDHHGALEALQARVKDLHPAQRLPLLDICIPALARLSKPQYETFMHIVMEVIKADGQVSLFEWTVHTILVKHLGERFDPGSKKHPSSRPLRTRLGEIRQILATTAYIGEDDLPEVQKAYDAGLSKFGIDGSLPEKSVCSLRNLRHALSKLAVLRYADRQRLLTAVGACIDHDGRTSIEEAQLLRGIADSIDCPMPPIVHGETAA